MRGEETIRGLADGLTTLRSALRTAGLAVPQPALAGSGSSAPGPGAVHFALASPASPRSAVVRLPGVGETAGSAPAPSPLTRAPEVIRRAQAGDGAAFAELYDRYVDMVYRYVYYRVASVALAEDLTSETFVRALRRLPKFEWQGRDFGAWLVTIARNLIADHYKSGRYRLEVATEDVVLAASSRASSDSPESEVIDSLTNATLLEAVKRLNPEQQECVVLRFLQGLSVAETAQAMGKNEGAIKALQYRAVRTLGRMLPPEMAE